MVYSSYFSKTLCLSAILSIISFAKTSYAFNIAPRSPNSMFIGSSFALVFTNLGADWVDTDTKLAVLNSNNVLEVVAMLSTGSHSANNYADILYIPSNIPEGSNYYFISQVSGGSDYAESGPHNIPKSFSPLGANLPSVTAATVLETYSLDTPPPLAVAQTSAPSSSTTDSVAPTPTVSSSSADTKSVDTKSSSATATPKSSEASSKSNTASEETPADKIISLSKTVIIVIAVVVPVVAISIISLAIFCFVRRRRRMSASSGTTPWGTRTTHFVTIDPTTGAPPHY